LKLRTPASGEPRRSSRDHTPTCLVEGDARLPGGDRRRRPEVAAVMQQRVTSVSSPVTGDRMDHETWRACRSQPRPRPVEDRSRAKLGLRGGGGCASGTSQRALAARSRCARLHGHTDTVTPPCSREPPQPCARKRGLEIRERRVESWPCELRRTQRSKLKDVRLHAPVAASRPTVDQRYRTGARARHATVARGLEVEHARLGDLRRRGARRGRPSEPDPHLIARVCATRRTSKRARRGARGRR